MILRRNDKHNLFIFLEVFGRADKLFSPYLQFEFEHQVDEEAFFAILENSHFLQSVQMDVDGNLSLKCIVQIFTNGEKEKAKVPLVYRAAFLKRTSRPYFACWTRGSQTT